MAEVSYKQEIIERLEHLNTADQRKVLDFLRSFEVGPQGVSGKSLLRFVGAIQADDLDKIAQAIEEDCERVDWNEW